MSQDHSIAVSTDAWRAVAELYHAYFTGIVLFTVSRLGPCKAEELVYEIFCRQRRERFLPGLRKLGIDHLPPAVAAAQYHYLSNHIGGVPVEFMPETERKSWIRYAPPRWIWADTALCGIPPEVSRAMLLGWHAQNGTMLNNPRLGFVCTKQTVDGQSALEGYYFEYVHDLAPHERLRFARNEDAPDFDPAKAPTLPTEAWPPERLAKAHRNYALEYVRSAFSTALALWGPDEASSRLRLTGKLIGMQFYHSTVRRLGEEFGRSALGFGRFLKAIAVAHGDNAEVVESGGDIEVRQFGWAFREGIAEWDAGLDLAWNGLFEGALQAHNHRLSLSFAHLQANGGHELRWEIAERR